MPVSRRASWADCQEHDNTCIVDLQAAWARLAWPATDGGRIGRASGCIGRAGMPSRLQSRCLQMDP